MQKVKRVCGECIHLYACKLWNNGQMEHTDATSCHMFETVEDSTIYYLGRMQGRKEVKDASPGSV